MSLHTVYILELFFDTLYQNIIAADSNGYCKKTNAKKSSKLRKDIITPRLTSDTNKITRNNKAMVKMLQEKTKQIKKDSSKKLNDSLCSDDDLLSLKKSVEKTRKICQVNKSIWTFM